jgi:hypothetical protein
MSVVRRKHLGAAWIGLLARAIVLSVTLAIASTGTAWAGEYHVYSCRTPAGAVAPTEGWSGSVSGLYDSDPNGCETGGGLVAALNAGIAHPADTDLASWIFNAPPGDVIAAATLWRAGVTPGGSSGNASYMFDLTGVANTGPKTQVFDTCAALSCGGEGSFSEPLASENRVVVQQSALNSPYLSLNALCGSLTESNCPATPSTGYAAEVELFAADIVLDQPQGPSVQAVGGALTEATTVSGTTDLALRASDPGAGIYEALFNVDGRTVATMPLDEEAGHCRAVGQAADGLPAFLYARPCSPSVSVDVPFDTTGLSNGTHHLVVSVTDAAGNAAVVLEREITVANATGNGAPGTGAANGPQGGAGAAPPVAGQPTGGQGLAVGAPEPTESPANGQGATVQAVLSARWRGSTSERMKVSFGQPPPVEGRLAGPGGQGITGAVIDVSETPQRLGATPVVLASVRTGSDGTWRLTLPRDMSSSSLRFSYRAHLGDLLPVATRTLNLTVRAGVKLRITPLTTTMGHSIHFKGTLRGEELPPGGKELVLEARSPGGRWIQFNVIRSGRHGRFRASYRFRLPGPERYEFRVLSKHEADFPYAEGASPVIDVEER